MTDQTDRTALPEDAVLSTEELSAMAIYDRRGTKLGVIRQVYVSKVSGRIQFVVGATGGLLGVGEKFHPIPWEMLDYNATPEGYVAQFEKSELRDAPAYDREQLANPHYGWPEQVRRYFHALLRG